MLTHSFEGGVIVDVRHKLPRSRMLKQGMLQARRVIQLSRHLASATPNQTAHQPPFRKVLVANRGEIALRVLRAAHELGCATAAVFDPAHDTGAPHCEEAGEAWALQSKSGTGYVDGEAILRCAAAAGADAIHPGYGFLSEDATFAAAVEAAGLVWVGPPPKALHLFGDKVAARAHAVAHGVRVAAGSEAPVASAEEALAVAQHLGIGWPLLLKAAHGGGGRGIRRVARPEDLPAAFEAAAREAAGLRADGAGSSTDGGALLFVEEWCV